MFDRAYVVFSFWQCFIESARLLSLLCVLCYAIVVAIDSVLLTGKWKLLENSLPPAYVVVSDWSHPNPKILLFLLLLLLLLLVTKKRQRLAH